MKKGNFQVSEIITNFRHICVGANPRMSPPPTEQVKIAFAGGEVAHINLVSLEKPSKYDHKLRDSKTLFYTLLAPGDVFRTGDFEFDETPGGDQVLPVLFMNEKLDRWIGGITQETWNWLDSRNIILIDPEVKLVFAGVVYFNGLGFGEDVIGLPTHINRILGQNLLEVSLPAPLEEKTPEPTERTWKNIIKTIIQQTFKIILVHYEEVKIRSADLWPIRPLPSQFTSQGKGALYRFLNACGEEADPAHYTPISLSELDAPVRRDGVTPRLKWKKLGV